MRLSVPHLHRRLSTTLTPQQISPTEWSRAVRVIHRLEKALRQLIHLEKVAPIPHEILLACDALNPFAVVRVRRRPESHLVGFASQVYECYCKTRLASAL